MIMLLFLKFGISVFPKRNRNPSLSINQNYFKTNSDTLRNIFKFVLIDDLFGVRSLAQKQTRKRKWNWISTWWTPSPIRNSKATPPLSYR
ncbi:hypothetical protein THOE12_20262 [Vibrio rotiferianus]|nr:hypothetical protein THOE12_20262 [Vibrio rotiferianus]